MFHVDLFLNPFCFSTVCSSLLFHYFSIWLIICYWCWQIVRLTRRNVEGKIRKLHFWEDVLHPAVCMITVLCPGSDSVCHIQLPAFEKETFCQVFLLSRLKLFCGVLHKTIFLGTLLKSPANQRPTTWYLYCLVPLIPPVSHCRALNAYGTITYLMVAVIII